MDQRLLPLLFLFVTVATARARVENWIEVRSPHFVVATTANEKQARRIADQFERMRSLGYRVNVAGVLMQMGAKARMP